VSGQRASYELALEHNFESAPFTVGPGQDTWDLKIASDVPMKLETSLVFGAQTVNLAGTQVEDLKVETVFGRTDVWLPAKTSPGVKASVVFGELVLRVPRGTPVVIRASRAFTGLALPAGFTRDGDMIYSPEAQRGSPATVQVDLPFGSLRIEYQPGVDG
jgi:hypothetical protein